MYGIYKYSDIQKAIRWLYKTPNGNCVQNQKQIKQERCSSIKKQNKTRLHPQIQRNESHYANMSPVQYT